MSNFTERLSKCYTGVVHDIMRDMEYKNFTLSPDIKPCKNNHVLGNFNEMRIVLEALIKYKNDELDWDVKKTLEEYRDLVHKIWI